MREKIQSKCSRIEVDKVTVTSVFPGNFCFTQWCWKAGEGILFEFPFSWPIYLGIYLLFDAIDGARTLATPSFIHSFVELQKHAIQHIPVNHTFINQFVICSQLMSSHVSSGV